MQIAITIQNHEQTNSISTRVIDRALSLVISKRSLKQLKKISAGELLP